MRLLAGALLLAAIPLARAHRLDEYLQATTVDLRRDHVRLTMFLSPGIAVFPRVIAGIDPNADGMVSEAEGKAYAERVRRDLSLSLDGKPLRLRLVLARYPKVAEMRKGLGYLHLEFDAPVPDVRGARRLVFENRHQRPVAAYLANCLLPDDPSFRVTGQTRSFTQSRYQVDYARTGPRPDPRAGGDDGRPNRA